MKRIRHTAEQIIRKLKTTEQLMAQGKTDADVSAPFRSPSRPITVGSSITAGRSYLVRLNNDPALVVAGM